MNLNTWDKRFLDMAELVSGWSKDPSTQVGSVITDGIRFVSLGFNGLPEKIPDLEQILNSREVKLRHILHAEINAICFADRPSLEGCTIYTYPFLFSYVYDHIIAMNLHNCIYSKDPETEFRNLLNCTV